jgi:hypothetical protein
MEQLSKPSGLSYAIGDGTLLDLCSRVGDDGLPLSRPEHQVVPQEHRIAGRRVACVWTTGPVSVHVDNEVGATRTMQKKIVVRCPLEVVQDALHGR